MTQDPIFLIAVSLFVAVLARCIRPNLVTVLLLVIVLTATTAYVAA